MKSKRMKFIAALILFLLCTAPAFAQEESLVKMKIDLVAWGNEIPGLALKEPSGKTSTALSFTYNKSQNYSGPKILALYQLETKKESAYNDEEEEAIAELRPPKIDSEIDIRNSKNPLIIELFERRIKEPKLVSLIPLPTDSRHVTILLAPASEGTFQPYVIDDDPRKLPSGKLRVHNLSPFPIRMEQIRGKQRRQLQTKDKILFDADETNRFVYRLSYQRGDKWKVQTNNSVRVPENQQTQLIILKSQSQFFLSSDGSQQGFLQTALLKRKAE